MQLELSELRRGVSVHEAEMNSICTPLNYSSRDAAPERAARGNKGCWQHNCTANISGFRVAASLKTFGV